MAAGGLDGRRNAGVLNAATQPFHCRRRDGDAVALILRIRCRVVCVSFNPGAALTYFARMITAPAYLPPDASILSLAASRRR